jgi:hypothetical protein
MIFMWSAFYAEAHRNIWGNKFTIEIIILKINYASSLHQQLIFGYILQHLLVFILINKWNQNLGGPSHNSLVRKKLKISRTVTQQKKLRIYYTK